MWGDPAHHPSFFMTVQHTPYWDQVAALVERIASGEEAITLGHLAGGSKAFFLAHLTHLLRRPLMVIAPTASEAEVLARDLNFFLTSHAQASRAVLFPAWGIPPYEPASPKGDITAQRLLALRSMLQPHPPIVVTTPEAIIPLVIPRPLLQQAGLDLTSGMTLERHAFVEQLLRCGYHQVDMVEECEEFSIRGGIIDLSPAHLPRPVRLEFVDDDLESMREFDPVSQRSLKAIDSVAIVPLRELPGDLPAWSAVERRAEVANLDLHRLHELFDCLERFTFPPGVERLLPLFCEPLESFFDYLPPDALLVLDEPTVIEAKLDALTAVVEEGYRGALLRQDVVLPPAARYLGNIIVGECTRALQRVVLQSFGADHSESQLTEILDGHLLGSFQGRWEAFVRFVGERLQDDFTLLLAASTAAQARHMQALLQEHELAGEILSTPAAPFPREHLRLGTRQPPVDHAKSPPPQRPPATGKGPGGGTALPSRLLICVGNISAGFVLPSARFVCVDERELWGIRRPRDRPWHSSPRARLFNYRDLKPGDYIVHLDYGIGVYRGTTILKVGAEESEFLSLEYADQDKVYVPIDALHLVQKYLGAGGELPPLSKLGSGAWKRTKRRVKAAIREVAQELVRLYAVREMTPGYAYSSDNHWHQQFEVAFQFEETEGQLRAIEEVKADMEKARPMDRLVCGDVGYGKTEVALRAAFKAVMDGKQVAILVPTTILALQHWQTFLARFSAYPVSVEMLSRFRSTAEQHRVLQGLRTGSVDIVIGTHRLLQKDVQFKALGLLIIDEEHRFGVVHKERLKHLHKQVDVLTLTATPIPRTLHLSMVGIRDMTVIETPPPNRLSIRTYVLKFGEGVIQEAIERELARGGQVFFVHNRVESIGAMYRYLRRIVPRARIAVGHGQLPERELERVMVRFLQREVDVLLCTTIIESGLDIPSVNTIIVNRADRFGLAQLYQLRGRVGRDQIQAYAYLLIPGEKILAGLPWERLKAILEFADLGSGLQLAMRDLEIRGAGNILGVAQSGHIAAVGFELYCELMDEAIRELKGEVVGEEKELKVVLKIGGFIPKSYIPHTPQRLDAYQRLYAIETEEMLAELRDELTDRYGTPPEAVEKLFRLVELRALARQLGLLKIERQHQTVVFVFDPSTPVPPEKIIALLREYPHRLRFNAAETLELALTVDAWPAVCDAVKKILQRLL
ncbi:MAG: transcription-repair coupling factor [Nitrospinae bacterium]|nr:transcription-repair coupling factor [Nitrospinota bacterium]